MVDWQIHFDQFIIIISQTMKRQKNNIPRKAKVIEKEPEEIEESDDSSTDAKGNISFGGRKNDSSDDDEEEVFNLEDSSNDVM
jgi:hypothetical protein